MTGTKRWIRRYLAWVAVLGRMHRLEFFRV